MRLMNEKDYKHFENFVKMSQPSLKKVMSYWLKEKYQTVVETKDYIYAVGDIPIALAAHMDTVFTHPVQDLYYDTKKNVLWSPDGLGADDRAGIFAIWHVIASGMRPHIILSTDEERGCLGARELAKIPCPFDNLCYIIQLDRRGSNDCVFYDCDNREFTAYVENFGFVEAFGTFTDITEYCPAWGVAGVNLSIGYYNEHSVSETLHVNILYDTIRKVKNMLRETEIPKFEYIPCAYDYGYAYNYGGWGTGIVDLNKKSSVKLSCGMEPCSKCGQPEYSEEMFPVRMLDGSTKFYCPDCLTNENVEWCGRCYEANERDPMESYKGKKYLCKACRAIISATKAVNGKSKKEQKN